MTSFKKRSRTLIRCALVVAAVVAVSQTNPQNLVAQTNRSGDDVERAAAESERTGRPPMSLMRRKLGSTQKVLEGLTTENMRLVIEGSDELLSIADEASWKVSRDAIYIHYSRDFQRTIRGLQDAAKRGSVEEATFAYTHAMVTCMACHRHVRGVVPMSTQ